MAISPNRQPMGQTMTLINEREFNHPGVFINVLGLIGSGKSELTKHLVDVIQAETGNCMGIFEPASKTNPYLADYYQSPERWGFTIQVFLLNRRLEQCRLAQSLCLSGENCVADSSIFSDSVFVNMLEKSGTMDKRDANTYFELFQNMSRDLMYPTAVLYLDVPIDVALHRISKRMSEKEGRKCEAGIDPSYLHSLQVEYEQLLTGLQRYTHVIRIDWSQDKTQSEIREAAKTLYHDVLSLRRIEPIRCFIGL